MSAGAIFCFAISLFTSAIFQPAPKNALHRLSKSRIFDRLFCLRRGNAFLYLAGSSKLLTQEKQMPTRTLATLLALALSLQVFASIRDVNAGANPSSIQQEEEGAEALAELGYQPDNFSSRQKREAALIREYQSAWNFFDPTVTDFSQSAAPELIMGFYTDAQNILYRDLCVPRGLKTKQAFGQYLRALYQKFPRQIWGHGWEKIHLFAGAKPGEWSYYYNFAMYRSNALAGDPALSGTGMERVQFDDMGKLVSDEVHLIIESGVAACSNPASK